MAAHSLYEHMYERDILLVVVSFEKPCDSVSCMGRHSLYEHVLERENLSLFVSHN